MGLLLFYLFIALFFSFTCSVLEAVLLSVTPLYIRKKIQDGYKTGKLLKKFKENIDRPLAAILTLNTFAHTIGAAGVGAQAQEVWGNEYLSVVSAVMTIVILIFSEIIPKTLGANNWQRLGLLSAHVLKVLIFVLYPFVILAQVITKILKSEESTQLSRKDFSAMTEIGYQEGVFKKGETKIIQNLLKFNQILVKDIMTPRTVVFTRSENISIKEFYHSVTEKNFSRIPVYSGNIDNVTGFVLKDEVLEHMINKEEDLKLKDIKRNILIIYDKITIPQLFNDLMEKREHIALVVDEYGGMAGIVTMEDVIETLLGMEIIDEMDKVADMQRLARKNWKKRAMKMGLIDKDIMNDDIDEE